MSADIARAVQLLDNSGILARLKNEAQAEREIERENILQHLAEVEAQAATAGLVAAELVATKAAEVAALELKLAEARRDLNKASNGNASLYAQACNLRGRLRRLADPAIDEAIAGLSAMSDRCRSEFRGVSSLSAPDKMTGKRKMLEVTNTDQITDILQTVTASRLKLEALKEAPRPSNLEAVIANLTTSPRNKLRELVGV